MLTNVGAPTCQFNPDIGVDWNRLFCCCVSLDFFVYVSSSILKSCMLADVIVMFILHCLHTMRVKRFPFSLPEHSQKWKCRILNSFQVSWVNYNNYNIRVIRKRKRKKTFLLGNRKVDIEREALKLIRLSHQLNRIAQHFDHELRPWFGTNGMT